MTKIALFNFKGGAAKTWLTFNLAAAIKELHPEARVRFVDLTTVKALSDLALGLPEVDYIRAPSNAPLYGLSGDFDYALMDCPPELPRSVADKIFEQADIILVPIRAEAGAATEATDTVMTALPSGKIVKCLLTDYVGRQEYCRNIRRDLWELVGPQMLKTIIPMYHVFREAGYEGKTIFQHAPESSAAKAFLKFAKELEGYYGT